MNNAIGIGVAIGIVIAMVIYLLVISDHDSHLRQGHQDSGTPTPEQWGPPSSAPTIDYESLAGLDPQTVQTIRERERNNDLEFRVEHLERQVRRLNQVTLGIPSIRIGDDGNEIIDHEADEPEPIYEAPGHEVTP